MATRNQLFRLYFPTWRRAFTANWLRSHGSILAAPQRHTSEILTEVEAIAEAGQRAEGVPLEERHLRHACHVLALGEDISSAALDNRQLDRCLLAFRLLADPDDLKAMVAWTNPRQPDLRRLSWAIRHSPPLGRLHRARVRRQIRYPRMAKPGSDPAAPTGHHPQEQARGPSRPRRACSRRGKLPVLAPLNFLFRCVRAGDSVPGMDAKETVQSGSQRTTVAPVLRWPGGKRRMLKHLLPLVPPHTCYVEAFAGGLALLLAKPPSPVEIVNDLNGDLVALYRCVQYHLPELLRELSHLVASRSALKDCLAQPGLTDIQRGARFYFRNRISFGGSGDSFGVSKTSGGGVAFRSDRNEDLLSAVRPRLSGVVIENLPYQRCLELYDSDQTFFFLDPPYLHAKPRAYAGWDESDMEAFRKAVRKLRGKWIVTVDDSQFNQDLWAGCQVRRIETRNGCVNHRTHGGVAFGELIIQPPEKG